jgi:hypothetical protein
MGRLKARLISHINTHGDAVLDEKPLNILVGMIMKEHAGLDRRGALHLFRGVYNEVRGGTIQQEVAHG